MSVLSRQRAEAAGELVLHRLAPGHGRAQVNTVKRLNERSAKERHLTIGCFHDFVEVLNDNDPRASMITGVWFGMTIGILPDGSSHS